MTEQEPSKEPVEAPLERRAETLAEPFREFVNAQSSSGWLLLTVTFAAVAVANSPWRELYFDVVHAELGLSVDGSVLRMSLHDWVASGLMAVFFLLLGLELKRELLVGRLSDLSRARSVLCAALGGMAVPALVFSAVATGSAVRQGWGIPVATDTAFALMVLVLLGSHIPVAARAFLVGLAIIDDLGAILVITFVYTRGLDLSFLWPALACIAVLVALNLTGVRKALPYAIVGCVLWLVFIEFGLHGTLAGVVVALAAPVRPGISRGSFVYEVEDRLHEFEKRHDRQTHTILEQPRQQELALDVLRVTEKATVPLKRWEEHLQKPVSFLVMPMFAFASAGVELAGRSAMTSRLFLATGLGLLLGKPIGICLGVWIGKRLGIAELPENLDWRHLVGIGLLGSIGFTMSLFIATLSFGSGTSPLQTAKQSVIMASLLAGLLGYAWLRWACRSSD